MKNTIVASIAAALIAILTLPALAGESMTKLSGTFYFDYFADLTDRPDTDQTAQRGFEIRRAYLTMKKSWGDVMFRATTDVDYKFGTGNLNVYAKYLYLQHSGLIDNAKLLVGQHSPNTQAWIESKWRYRSMEKTMSDAAGWTDAATFGAGLQGKASEGMFEYSVDLNNGNGYKAPVRKDGIGFAARGVATPSEGVSLSALFTSNTPGTYLHTDGVTVKGSDQANTYIEGAAGYEQDRYSIFGQYGMFENGASDVKSSGLSIFGRALLTDGTYGVARLDVVDPDTDMDDDGYNWVLVGVDYELHEGYFLQPSLRVKKFQSDAVESVTEFVLTFFGNI